MVNSQKYTYPEIAERLKRSEAAIKRKLYDLGAKNPKQTKKRLWTPEQEQLIISMYNQGYGLNTIAQKVGKSALAVRGKFERLGYFFRNGVPIPPVNQYNS
jgi:DNA-binding NarL/FixJ family response regulator